MKKRVETNDAPRADHILSQALVVGDTIYLAGQIHNKPDGSLVDGSVADKLKQIMCNVEAILNAAGAKLEDIVKVTIYLTDMAMLPEFNEEYPKYFKEPFPVREAVCVKALPLGADIELSVTAVRND